MAKDLVGLRKRLNAKMKDADLSGKLQKHGKGVIQDAINDWLVAQIKDSGLEQWLAGQIGDLVKSLGFDLTLTNIRDKDATREDFDKAVTAKINALAGTKFETLQHVSKDAISLEVGRLLGDKLGIGPLFPVANFRDEFGGQLVQAFEGGGGSELFPKHVLEAVEKNVVSGWQELTEKATTVGNPMSKAGPPRDDAHAVQRAEGRKRQAKFRRSHNLHWVPIGEGGESTGNGRDGLTGRDSGNGKPVRQ